MMLTRKTITSLAAFFSMVSAPAVLAQDFNLSWHTIDGGGGSSSGGAFTLLGTIAQPDAGTLKGGAFTLQGGFIPGATSSPSTGACCLPDGACEEGLTEPECSQKEGVQWHDGKACNEVECPPPGGCNGKETIKKAKCKTKRGAVKKVIVLVKNGTPGEVYTATLTAANSSKRRPRTTARPSSPSRVTIAPDAAPTALPSATRARTSTAVADQGKRVPRPFRRKGWGEGRGVG